MSILEVSHRTVYRYRRPVRFGEHRAMFRPRDSHDLRILATELVVSPNATVRWMHDVFSNSITVLDFHEPARILSLESRIKVRHYWPEEPEFPIDPAAESWPFDYSEEQLADLGRTVRRHYPDPDGEVAAWARSFVEGRPGLATLDLLSAMTRAIKRDFRYATRHEHGTRPPALTLREGRGSCRDLALLMMEAARSLGFAARFVSGYLYDPALDGATESMAGAGATHAWAQVFLPSAGWIEFDPTNGIVGGRNLIRVAVARDPSQAIPVAGTYFGAPDDFLDLSVEVEVRAARDPGRGPSC